MRELLTIFHDDAMTPMRTRPLTNTLMRSELPSTIRCAAHTITTPAPAPKTTEAPPAEAPAEERAPETRAPAQEAAPEPAPEAREPETQEAAPEPPSADLVDLDLGKLLGKRLSSRITEQMNLLVEAKQLTGQRLGAK